MEKDETCIACGKDAELKKETLSLLDGRVVIDDEHYECPYCGEKFSTSEQVGKAAKKIREKYNFERKIISTGRSLAVTFSPDFKEFYHLHKGSKVILVPEGKRYARMVFK